MKRKNVWLFFLAVSLFPLKGTAQYWKIAPNDEIVWTVGAGAHFDHIEMSGQKMSVVLRYGVNERGGFEINRSMVWPMLRTIPNDTHGSLMRRFDWNPLDGVTINGRPLDKGGEKITSICLNGTMIVNSTWSRHSLALKRTFIPSTDLPSLVEVYQWTNTGNHKVVIEIPQSSTILHTVAERGVNGSYRLELALHRTGCLEVEPGNSVSFSATLSAYKADEHSLAIDAEKELLKRSTLVSEWKNSLRLETPDPVINTMFAFSKIRACESIYATKSGPMHGPGGEAYYAAVWANDQAEYVNPFFPFVGYSYANESALHSFLLFASYMNEEWKPIPSSIIAEGDGYWNGAGDRGDAAMIAYGAARYALARGDKEEALQLWPLIEWCLEYNRRKLNEAGVVSSDTDELERRFPAGEANLCTSSLYYDALLSAAYLAEELGQSRSTANRYRKQAETLKQAIDSYFASKVEEFDTYAYYEGNDILRSWICMPLIVGINQRAAGTIEALFSPRLWTNDGLLTQAGSSTFWDRSTLYALRGAFMAGEMEKAMSFMKHYSTTRLLGNHVPYAIEAWPEGEQRHLSAESALYARVITEGVFGIRPVGLHTFSLTPWLPSEWNNMALRNVQAFGKTFDIKIVGINARYINIAIESGGKTVLDKKIKRGTSVVCKL